MKSSLFDYHLPLERIAQSPCQRRDQSRLLVVHRSGETIEHRRFSDLHAYLGQNDVIFRNAAKVLPGRILAHRPTGGKVECLLLRPSAGHELEWWCLLRPGKRLPPGETFGVEGKFQATVLEKNEEAEYKVRFVLQEKNSVMQLAESLGKMPLPPYINREREDARDDEDKNRYQTTYAARDKAVAAAAPTAGLHFTPELTETLREKGTTFHDLILHVGMGTFKPLDAEEIEAHPIHREIYEIPQASRTALERAKENGQRRVCVGTTSVRSIEDYLARERRDEEGVYLGEAGIYIYPPYSFRGVDALITNFHLPKSTLLCLVSAFLKPGNTDGINWLIDIYKEAIAKEYRFLSYGDAMLIL